MLKSLDDIKKVDDYLANQILNDNAEEVWNFVVHNEKRHEEYCKGIINYSMAEFVKNHYMREFLEYLGEEY